MSFWERRRRRRFPFDEFTDWFEEFEEMIEEFFRTSPFRDLDKMRKDLPKTRLSDGTEVTGPIVWGWSIKIGPDGKPEVREFGNVPRYTGEPSPSLIREVREPLVDVVEGDKEIIVVAETPGVDKEEISLNCTEDELEIKAGDKYYKRVKLPAPVKPDEAKASYKNGILEVKIPRLEKKGHGIKVE